MKEEIINTLKDLLSYKTYEENKKEFDGIFEYIKSKYNNLYISEYEFNGKKSIVLSNTDSKSFDIIFCGHVDVVHHDTYDYTEVKCNINNFLQKSRWYWTISPSTSISSAFSIRNDGYVRQDGLRYSGSIFPSIYLNSNVKIISGDGLESVPYVLSF